MRKRQSWRKQRDIHNAITRELAAVATKPVVYTCALPPPRNRRAAEKERLRAIVRETLADKRRKATCKVCGGKIERTAADKPWSHVLSILDEHVAAPFSRAGGGKP